MALDDVLRLLPTSPAGTVLIDGRSGSGKSTLARRLTSAWSDSVLVGMDHVYPGWDGLAWAVDHVQTELLQPRSEGRDGHWRSWNWTRGQPGVWHTVGPATRLIVEGVGALTQQSRAVADLAIWVDADDDDRKRRALRRDGETYLAQWDRWAAQEVAFIARFAPRRSADVIAVLDGNDVTVTTAGRT